MPDVAKRIQDAIARAIRIARRVAQADDLEVRKKLGLLHPPPDYSDRKRLRIADEAWAVVLAAKVKPQLVFCHPDILKSFPQASMHYRGMGLISRKRVQEIAGSVDAWERSPATAKISDAKAAKVAGLYNAVVSSIILDNEEWTLEDGYRNVLAAMGITEDGVMRNVIGREAEQAVKLRILRWVRQRGLLADPDDEVEYASDWRLKDGVDMRFGAEPDIAFHKDGKLAVLIEIKGGKDPAGALERLGAVRKTFAEAPVDCRNFLVAGVITATMRTRLREMRMEKHFDIDRLLADNDAWGEFMNEVFHHGLRIAPDIGPAA